MVAMHITNAPLTTHQSLNTKSIEYSQKFV